MERRRDFSEKRVGVLLFVCLLLFLGGGVMFGGRKGGRKRMISENMTLMAYRVVYDIAVFFLYPDMVLAIVSYLYV